MVFNAISSAIHSINKDENVSKLQNYFVFTTDISLDSFLPVESDGMALKEFEQIKYNNFKEDVLNKVSQLHNLFFIIQHSQAYGLSAELPLVSNWKYLPQKNKSTKYTQLTKSITLTMEDSMQNCLVDNYFFTRYIWFAFPQITIGDTVSTRTIINMSKIWSIGQLYTFFHTQMNLSGMKYSASIRLNRNKYDTELVVYGDDKPSTLSALASLEFPRAMNNSPVKSMFKQPFELPMLYLSCFPSTHSISDVSTIAKERVWFNWVSLLSYYWVSFYIQRSLPFDLCQEYLNRWITLVKLGSTHKNVFDFGRDVLASNKANHQGFIGRDFLTVSPNEVPDSLIRSKALEYGHKILNKKLHFESFSVNEKNQNKNTSTNSSVSIISCSPQLSISVNIFYYSHLIIKPQTDYDINVFKLDNNYNMFSRVVEMNLSKDASLELMNEIHAKLHNIGRIPVITKSPLSGIEKDGSNTFSVFHFLLFALWKEALSLCSLSLKELPITPSVIDKIMVEMGATALPFKLLHLFSTECNLSFKEIKNNVESQLNLLRNTYNKDTLERKQKDKADPLLHLSSFISETYAAGSEKSNTSNGLYLHLNKFLKCRSQVYCEKDIFSRLWAAVLFQGLELIAYGVVQTVQDLDLLSLAIGFPVHFGGVYHYFTENRKKASNWLKKLLLSWFYPSMHTLCSTSSQSLYSEFDISDSSGDTDSVLNQSLFQLAAKIKTQSMDQKVASNSVHDLLFGLPSDIPYYITPETEEILDLNRL